MPRAAQLVRDPRALLPNPMDGHVTSYRFSPTLDRWIALALVKDGRARIDERDAMAVPLQPRGGAKPDNPRSDDRNVHYATG